MNFNLSVLSFLTSKKFSRIRRDNSVVDIIALAEKGFRIQSYFLVLFAKKYLSYFCSIKVKCGLAKFNTSPFQNCLDFYSFFETFLENLVLTQFARAVIFVGTHVACQNMSICFSLFLEFLY